MTDPSFAQPLKRLADSGIGVAAAPSGGMGLALDEKGRLPASVINEWLPWVIDIDVFATASNVNWNTISTHDTGVVYQATKTSSGAQNAELSWEVILAAGTWSVELIHHKANDNGVCSVYFDDVLQGTIDFYAAGASDNNRSNVVGVVAAPGKVVVKLKMASKNGASSNYFGDINHLQLHRTA